MIVPAIQTIPPSGAVERFLYWAFGPSYRTGVSGVISGLGVVASGILSLCPHLVAGQWDRKEMFVLLLTLVAGGGTASVGIFSKDRAVSGVQK